MVNEAKPTQFAHLETPTNAAEFQALQATLRTYKTLGNPALGTPAKPLFPEVKAQLEFDQSNNFAIINAINPATDLYTETHLEALFKLDGWGRDGKDGFAPTISGLKKALGVSEIKWGYLPCRTGIGIAGRPEAFEMCWLNALVNASRFYDQSLLKEENVLNNSQWQKLVTLLFSCIPEFSTIPHPALTKTRYHAIIKALKAKFTTNNGFWPEALTAALFANRNQLLKLETTEPLIKQYLSAIHQLLYQCVQIPKVRSKTLLNPNLAPTIFMYDGKRMSPDFKNEQMHTPVLGIDPAQAISKEQLNGFTRGQLPIIFLFAISHNTAIDGPKYCVEHNRQETPHVVAIKMTILKGCLYLEIIDSNTPDPLEQPSFVPGVLIVLKEFAQHAKLDGSGLWPEATLQHYSPLLTKLAELHDKEFPLPLESLPELKGILDQYTATWKNPSLEIVEEIEQYNKFILFLKEIFQALPDEVRYLYAQGFFNLPDVKALLPRDITWDDIEPVFLIGIGLTKDQHGFIPEVFKWAKEAIDGNRTKDLSSLQLQFRFKHFYLSSSLSSKASLHELYSNDHLKTCPECKGLIAQADKNDQARFAKWFNPNPIAVDQKSATTTPRPKSSPRRRSSSTFVDQSLEREPSPSPTTTFGDEESLPPAQPLPSARPKSKTRPLSPARPPSPPPLPLKQTPQPPATAFEQQPGETTVEFIKRLTEMFPQQPQGSPQRRPTSAAAIAA